MTFLSLDLSHRQQQTLSPRLQQAVRLLNLPTDEFLQTLDEALQHNPFLEGEPSSLLGEAPKEVVTPMADAGRARESMEDESLPHSWGEGHARALRQGATGLSALDYATTSVSLHEHLLSQLRLQRLPDRNLVLCGVLVESLENDGYLGCTLQEAAALAQLDPPATEEELSQALERVQALDPLGVGACDLAECLALQLSLLPDPEDRTLCARMLMTCAAQLARQDFRQVAKILHCPLERVRTAFAQLRRLDPHPGWRYGGSPPCYVSPDVLVRRTRQGWVATLNEAVVPRLRLNQSYASILEREGRAKGPLSAQLSEARWMLRNVEQRFSTVLTVAQAILRHQKNFFDYGPVALRPLQLRAIADEMGAHVSTISRVTNGKYMQTPSGTYELKYFFSRGLQLASGRECAPQAVRTLVREIIASETPDRPLSDVAITQLLERQGIRVARRTVTKYRQLLGISACEHRGNASISRSRAFEAGLSP